MAVNFYCPKCKTLSPGDGTNCAHCGQPFEGGTIRCKNINNASVGKRNICKGIIQSILCALCLWAFIGLVQTKVGIIGLFFMVLGCMFGVFAVDDFAGQKEGKCPYCQKRIFVPATRGRYKCPTCSKKVIVRRNSFETKMLSKPYTAYNSDVPILIDDSPETSPTDTIPENSEPKYTVNLNRVEPDIDFEEMKKRFFDRWSLDLQSDRAQRERLERAKNEGTCLRLQCVNPDNGTAICYSSDYEYNHLIYNVTYHSCTCPDYTRRYKPCKHMYALLLNLGVISANEDLSGIPEEIKEKIEMLPAESLKAFKKILLDHDDFKPFLIKKTPRYRPLFALELLFDTEDTLAVLNLLYSRNDLVAKIYESGLKYKPTSSTKKEEIILYLVENESAFTRNLVKTSALVRYDANLTECLHSIHSYYCNLY